MISDQTRKVLIFSKLKGVGRVKLEEIIKIEGFDIKKWKPRMVLIELIV